jgi:hypothetical protein
LEIKKTLPQRGNLNRRSQKAAEDFGVEVAQILGRAVQAGALGGSRTYLQFIDAGLTILARSMTPFNSPST